MTSRVIGSRNLAMEAVRVTESAAIAAARHMGRGDEAAADHSAGEAMCGALDLLEVDGLLRVGPGGDDAEALLHVGERVGTGHGPSVEVGLMPLEGASITARGGANALSIIAMAEGGGFLQAPELYMDKIAVGGGLPADVIDLDAEPADNLGRLAEARGVGVEDLVVCILDRPRHRDLIARVRDAGARILLITDGDVSGAIAATLPESGVDIFMGIGGAPQGVLTAAALACTGGRMQARFVPRSTEDRQKLIDCGIQEFDRKYGVEDMAAGDITFAATGVTSGTMLSGVRIRHGLAVSHSLVLRSRTGTLRYIEAHHDFARLGD